MSATPRTDAARREHFNKFGTSAFVAASKMEQLETELAEMTATAKRLAEALSMACAFPITGDWHEPGDAALTEAREKGLL